MNIPSSGWSESCPFCKSEIPDHRVFQIGGTTKLCILCKLCGAKGPATAEHGTPNDAVNLWNKRYNL